MTPFRYNVFLGVYLAMAIGGGAPENEVQTVCRSKQTNRSKPIRAATQSATRIGLFQESY